MCLFLDTRLPSLFSFSLSLSLSLSLFLSFFPSFVRPSFPSFFHRASFLRASTTPRIFAYVYVYFLRAKRFSVYGTSRAVPIKKCISGNARIVTMLHRGNTVVCTKQTVNIAVERLGVFGRTDTRCVLVVAVFPFEESRGEEGRRQ